MQDYWQHKEGINRLFNAPKHRSLKYSAIVVICLVILTQLATIFWQNNISYRTLLWIRGFVGLCALIFVVLVAILCYRVYSDYFKNRNKPSQSHQE